MSTILDALRKSEQERKLTKLPTLSDMPAPQEQTRWPHWVILGLIVLSVGLLVVVFGLWQGSDMLVGTQNPQSQGSLSQSNTIVVDNESIGEGATAVLADDDIIVNVVSFSEQADQRFVMINGKMFRENDFIRTGLKVVAIKPDSVIVNQRGRRMELEP
ncbi:MAG: hypothetical protein ACI9WC_000652 [Arenicella sp.]|jgi:hypothetical protein